MANSGPDLSPAAVKPTVAGGLDHATLAVASRLLNAPAASESRTAAGVLLQRGDLISSRYEVLEQLSEGGMGVVFRGVDRATGDAVALKVVRPQFRAGTDLMRFRHEYYLMATLRHPRFVRVLDYALTDAGLPCLVMEYVPGQDLHLLLPMPWQEAAFVLYQVCSALAFLHSRRYIHHDIKPANVRVRRDASTGKLEARLIDFGIMEPIGAAAGAGRGWVGTPAYLAPEALFMAPSDHRLDLYALGVMACEMLTGAIPFEMKDPESFLSEKQVEPPDIRARLSHVPNDLAELVADLMSPDPADRPYDVSVALRRLRLAGELSLAPDEDEKAPPYLHSSRLVAREDAVDRLLNAWVESARTSRLVAIEGPAGMGKTALLREAQLRFRIQSGVTVAVGGGSGSGGFRLLRTIFSELMPLGHCVSEASLARNAPALARIVPEVLEHCPGAQAAPPTGDPAEDLRVAYDALRDWLHAVLVHNRVALLIDDLDQADVGSLDALSALLATEDQKGLLLAFTHTSSTRKLDGSFARIVDAALRIELPAFSEQDVGELLEALFGRVQPNPRLVSALATTSEGNPSFLVEIIRRLVEEKVITFSDERWQLPRQLDAIPLPRTLAEAVRQRLDHLGPAAHIIVEALAVIDREIPLALLPHLLDRQEQYVFGGIDQLVAADLVQAREDAYRLPPLVRAQNLAEQVSPEQRVRLHRRFATLAESRLGDAANEHAAELAHHFRLGKNPERARHYLALASENLFATQALTDAVAPLQELERLLVEGGADDPASPDNSLLLTTRQRLARVGLAIDSSLAVKYFSLEREMVLPRAPGSRQRQLSSPLLQSAQSTLNVVRLVARELPWSRSARGIESLPERLRQYFVATSYLAACSAIDGSFARALEVAESLKAFATTPRGRAMSAYHICRSIPLVHQGRVLAAEESLGFAWSQMNDAKLSAGIPDMDLTSGLGATLACLTLLYSARGRAEGRQWLERLESFVEDDEHQLSFLLPNLLLAQLDYHLHRGEIFMAQQVERRYRAHRARSGMMYNPHVEAQILVSLARTALAARELVDAEALCAELRTRKPEDFFSHGWGACVSGELWALQRLFKRSREALSEARRYATRPNERSYKLELRALNSLSELELEEKNPHEARQLARLALATSRQAECRSEFEEMWALRHLASAALALDEIDVAHRRVMDLEDLATTEKNPLFSAVAQRARGDVARALGKRDDATAHSAAASQLFAWLGYVPSAITPQSQASTPGSSPFASERKLEGALSDALRATAPSRPRSTGS